MPTNPLPALTDSTIVRPICGGAKVAVASGPQGVAIILDATDDRVAPTCGWQYVIPFGEFCPPDCECEGQHGEMWAEAQASGGVIGECDGVTVCFPNGWMCSHGHSMFTNANYYDDDEIEAMRRGLLAVPTCDARSMEGALLS